MRFSRSPRSPATICCRACAATCSRSSAGWRRQGRSSSALLPSPRTRASATCSWNGQRPARAVRRRHGEPPDVKARMHSCRASGLPLLLLLRTFRFGFPERERRPGRVREDAHPSELADFRLVQHHLRAQLPGFAGGAGNVIDADVREPLWRCPGERHALQHSSTGSFAHPDHRVGAADPRHRHVLQLPVEQPGIERLCFRQIVGLQLDVNERIGHAHLLEAQEAAPPASLRQDRQIDRKGGTFPARALNLDPPAVRIDDLLCDVEPETHASVASHRHRALEAVEDPVLVLGDRKSTRLNSSHLVSSYAVFCLKKKKKLKKTSHYISKNNKHTK